MVPVFPRAVLASLLTSAVIIFVGSPSADAADQASEKPISPEMILNNNFTGKAAVEFRVAEVRTINIDSLFVPGVSHTQYIKAKVSEPHEGQEVAVIVAREVATRLQKLGIEDPAEHFREKVIRVSGNVERIKRPSPSAPIVFRIKVTSLDQLESVRKP